MKKIISLLCVVALLVMLMPSALVMADDGDATFEVVSVASCAGGTADVVIKMTNNPGVTSVQLKVLYDYKYLTLKNVTDGGILGEYAHSDKYDSSPYTLSWENDTSTTNYTDNGIIATLTFEVKENTPKGKYDISIFRNEQLNADGNSVRFGIVNGVIDVKDYMVGDVNSDGEVDTRDRMTLSRHLADWIGYEEIDKNAADVNSDNELDTRDRMFLSRHLAGWIGYETFPYDPTNEGYVFNLSDVLRYSSHYYDSYTGTYYTGILETEDKEYTIDPHADIYYNGYHVDDITSVIPPDSYLIMKNGTIELAVKKNTTIADFDTVYITVYDTIVVDSVNTKADRVTAKVASDSQLGRIEYNEDAGDVKAVLLDAKGKFMDWSDLKENDVLTVKYVATYNKTYIEAQVNNNAVTGVVTEIDQSANWGNGYYIAAEYKYVWVNGTEYKVMPCAEADKEIKVGDEGVYYLDKNNNIVYHIPVPSKSNYAYVIAAQNESGMDGARIKMLTEAGIATYEVDSRIYVTDMNINGNGMYERSTSKLAVDGQYFDLATLSNVLIKYEVNENGIVTAIEKPLNAINGANSTYDYEDYFTIHTSNSTLANFDSDDNTFGLYGLTDSTVIFDVSAADSEDWGTVSIDGFVDGQTLAGAYIYDIDDDDYMGAIVLTHNNGLAVKTDNYTITGVVEEITGTPGADDRYAVINGFRLKVLPNAETEREIKLGDEVKCYLDGYDNIYRYELIASGYGYVISAQNEAGMDGARIKMLTEEGIATYEVDSRIYVTDMNINGNGMYERSYNKLAVNGWDFDLTRLAGTLIVYKTDASGVVTAVEVALDVANNPMYDAEDYFTIHSANVTLSDYKYTDDAVIFDVSAYDIEDWGTVSAESIADGQKLNGAYVYNMDNNGYIDAVVLKEDNGLAVRTDNYTITGVVEEIAGTPGADDRYAVINGFSIKILPNAESERTIVAGDEIKCYLDGYDNIYSYELIASGYGYVISAQNEAGMDGARIKMLTEEGIATYEVDSRIYVTDMNINGNGMYERSYNKLAVNGWDFDLTRLAGTLIVYKTDASGVVTAVEVALDAANNPTYDAEDYFTIHASNVNLTNYDPASATFGRYAITNNTVVFDVTDTDNANWEIADLKNLSEGDSLAGAYVYNVDDDGNIGVIIVTNAIGTIISGNSRAATFITGVSEAYDEDGYLVTYVKGYCNGEEVVYESEVALSIAQTYIGKLVVPEYKVNGDIKAFQLVNEGYSKGFLGSSNYAVGYAGIPDGQDSAKGRIVINGMTYKIPATTNVYVYEASSSKRVKYTTDAYVGYVEYDDPAKGGIWGWYIDEDNRNLTVTVYMYEYDGDIVDLVYYVH